MDENSIRDNIRKKNECMSELNEAYNDTINRINTIIAAIIAAIVAIVVSVSSNSFEKSEIAVLILISCVIVPFVYFNFDLFVLYRLAKLRRLRALEKIKNDAVRYEFAKLKKYSKVVGVVKYAFVFLMSIATIYYLISSMTPSRNLF